jgi:hypothetical protein
MRKTILTAIAVFASVGALAQGTINMNSYPSITGARQNVLNSDGTPVAGADFWVQMYAGASPTSLAPVGAAINFQTGAAAGLFRDTAARVVPTVTPGADAIVQIAAWEASGGSTLEAAMAAGKKWGKSDPFTVKTGGDGQPPALPGNMTNFKGFSLIPEPSTIALGLLGAASLLFFRRK